MARNQERDRQEADRRKAQLVQAGFELFSRQGIESVSLNSVAEKAGVGVSTLYKYFQNKANLAVAISGWVWGGVWEDVLGRQTPGELAQMDPCQLFRLYADVVISLYRERPQVLRYSGNYKTYVCREGVPAGQLREHLDPLRPVADLFERSCEAARASGAIRTDVSTERLFSFVALTMLAMAERYAQGIVWTESPEADHADDLASLKDMLIAWMRGRDVRP